MLITLAAATPHFPPQYIGRWADSQAGCEEGAIHGGVTITGQSVEDGESSADIIRLKRRQDGSVDVALRWDDDGDRSTTWTHYRLIRNGAAMIARTGTMPPQTFRRCLVKR